MIITYKNGVKISYKKKCTTIYDCYKLTNKQINDVAELIVVERQISSLPVTRKTKSYANEIKAHKRAYKLGIMRSHTKDADLEEPIMKQRDIFYRIVGL